MPAQKAAIDGSAGCFGKRWPDLYLYACPSVSLPAPCNYVEITQRKEEERVWVQHAATSRGNENSPLLLALCHDSADETNEQNKAMVTSPV